MVGLSITWATETASLRIDRVGERCLSISPSLCPPTSGQDSGLALSVKHQLSFEIPDTISPQSFAVWSNQVEWASSLYTQSGKKYTEVIFFFTEHFGAVVCCLGCWSVGTLGSNRLPVTKSRFQSVTSWIQRNSPGKQKRTMQRSQQCATPDSKVVERMASAMKTNKERLYLGSITVGDISIQPYAVLLLFVYDSKICCNWTFPHVSAIVKLLRKVNTSWIAHFWYSLHILVKCF